jgi:hypothetical protein
MHTPSKVPGRIVESLGKNEEMNGLKIRMRGQSVVLKEEGTKETSWLEERPLPTEDVG